MGRGQKERARILARLYAWNSESNLSFDLLTSLGKRSKAICVQKYCFIFYLMESWIRIFVKPTIDWYENFVNQERFFTISVCLMLCYCVCTPIERISRSCFLFRLLWNLLKEFCSAHCWWMGSWDSLSFPEWRIWILEEGHGHISVILSFCLQRRLCGTSSIYVASFFHFG